MVPLPPVGVSLTLLFPWIMWFLWKAMNLFVFEDRSFTEKECLNKALAEARIWQQSTTRDCSAYASAHSDFSLSNILFHWRSMASFQCGMGWIIKSASKNILTQGTNSRNYIAEALALKSAILAAQEADISSMVCYSDCQDMIRLINSESHSNEL